MKNGLRMNLNQNNKVFRMMALLEKFWGWGTTRREVQTADTTDYRARRVRCSITVVNFWDFFEWTYYCNLNFTGTLSTTHRRMHAPCVCCELVSKSYNHHLYSRQTRVYLLPSRRSPSLPTPKQAKEYLSSRLFIFARPSISINTVHMSTCPICYKTFHKSGTTSSRNKLAQHATSTGHYEPKHPQSEGAAECLACHKVFYDGGFHSALYKLEQHEGKTGHCRRKDDRWLMD